MVVLAEFDAYREDDPVGVSITKPPGPATRSQVVSNRFQARSGLITDGPSALPDARQAIPATAAPQRARGPARPRPSAPANLPVFKTGVPVRLDLTADRNHDSRRTVRLLRSPR